MMENPNTSAGSPFRASVKRGLTIACVSASGGLLAPVTAVQAASVNDVFNLAKTIETKVTSAQAWAIGNGKRGITIIDGLAGDRTNYLGPILDGIDGIAPIASVLEDASGLVDADTRVLLIQQAEFIQTELGELQQAQQYFVSGTGDCSTSSCVTLRDQLVQLLNDMYALSMNLTLANAMPIDVTTNPDDFIGLLSRVPDFVLFPLYVVLQQGLDLSTVLDELNAMQSRVEQSKNFVLSAPDSQCESIADPAQSEALSTASQALSASAHWLDVLAMQIDTSTAVDVSPDVGVAGFVGASVKVDLTATMSGQMQTLSAHLARLGDRIDGAFDDCFKQTVTESLIAIKANLGIQ